MPPGHRAGGVLLVLGALVLCLVRLASVKDSAGGRGRAEDWPSRVERGEEHDRPRPEERRFSSWAVEQVIEEVSGKMRDGDLAKLFVNCFPNTLDTTVHTELDDQGLPLTFVVTGDIHAMWVRDSANQVLPYLDLAVQRGDRKLQQLICGVVRRQAQDVAFDPWANAFNKAEEGDGSQSDNRNPRMRPHVYEGKYELDSLAAFLRLSNAYLRSSGDAECFSGHLWLDAVERVLSTMESMAVPTSRLPGQEPYSFSRKTEISTDTLYRGNVGPPSCQGGMIRSYFRPSDDACLFPLNVPVNMMASHELKRPDGFSQLSFVFVVGLWQGLVHSLRSLQSLEGYFAIVPDMIWRAQALASGIDSAVHRMGTTVHPTHGVVFAYEVDGCGSQVVMDDANIPSLLSLPITAGVNRTDPLYSRTRKMLLSEDNPFYFRGAAGEGIGGPHIGPGYIWPMSIITQALTASSDAEIGRCLELLKASSAGTGFMHESFLSDDVGTFTRPWFAWVNTMFGAMILQLSETHPHVIFASDDGHPAAKT